MVHYLIKWRSLQYEDATWELAKDVDAIKIKEFEDRRHPKDWALKDKPRPKAEDWRKETTFSVFKNDNELRDYQQEGLNWLLFCWYNRQNCILADEMGLGKTIQSITFLDQVQKFGVHGPFLVIAPLSTIHNWQRESETWSNINTVVYHGTSMSRGMIAEYEMFYRDEAKDERIKGVYKFDLLITTYEMILVDCDALKEIPWRICIIDEAHRLKNRNCSLLKGLNQFRIEHRVLLTGTPLQNNIDELFSLLSFLEPKQFASRTAFLEEFGECQSDEQVTKIQDILKPMMLRRLKEDVEKNLKPKEETIVEVELTNIQKKYYRAILEKNFTYLSRGASAPSLMNTMMELRKCCNHPFLITGAEEQIMEEHRHSLPRDRKEHTDEEQVFQHCLVQSSGKMVLCDKLLPRLHKEGHKVLIFSQMVKVLNLIEDYLVDKRYPFERIDGNVRGDMRQAAIDRFSKPDSDRFVFLLCTRAGGLGINLTAADTCIIFDSDWNPQNDLQAQARCHRIGQQKHVKIYRLITRNTYEREMFDKASLKLGLDKAVLQSTGTKENCAAQLSKKEVEELLRKGAYAAVMDEASEGDKFCEEDIDQILQRRTQTITVQAGVKGSTFAKASFNMSDNREDIDVNDPNFWAKWAKKANVEAADPQAELILYTSRTRKRRFNDEVYNQMGASEDSDSDSEGGKRKRARPGPDGDLDYAPDELAFTKTDYFKVEKLLGIYGWGRWTKIQALCELKTDVSVDDVAHMCRTVLLHCLRNFTGDEKVREFVWDLIRPPDISDEEHKSYKSLRKQPPTEAPKGGRKSSRIAQNEKAEAEKELMDMYHQGWAALPAYNPPVMAVDYAYQRHLQRHANKVLLRVKLLHYLKEDIISHLDQKIDAGMPSEAINLEVPWHPELPVPWWDAEADKSLLIGIFKHGYEAFAEMRDDQCLCFLDRCGPSEFEEEKAARKAVEEAAEGEEEAAKANLEAVVEASRLKREALATFPSVAELNARFKRLVTLFQRSNRIHMAREEQRQKRASKQEHIQALLQEREMRKLEERQRWSRREETDFYRCLCSYGIEQNPDTGEYLWERFRILARLESKLDQTLTEHYTALHAMCKRVTKKTLSSAEEAVSFLLEPLSEDRASKLLSRVELLGRIRAAVRHPKLAERVALVQKTPDMPFWWQSPVHDADLLIGVAKHGVGKSEEAIVHDPELSFQAIWARFHKDPAVLAAELEAVAKAAKEPKEKKDKPTKSNSSKDSKEEEKDETEAIQDEADKDKEKKTEDNEEKEETKEAEKSNDDSTTKEEESAKNSQIESTKDADKVAEEEADKEKTDTTEEKKEEEKDQSTPAKKEEDKEAESSGEKEPSKESEKKAEESASEATDPTKSTSTEKNEKEGESKKEDKDKDTEDKSKENKSDKSSDEKKKVDESKTMPKSSKDPDTTISQILAQASGNTMQWPKERMIIYRLHNICYTIEHGEWPTGTNSKGSGNSAVNSDLDARSTTPESNRATPYEEAPAARDSPLYAFPGVVKGTKSGRATPKASALVATPTAAPPVAAAAAATPSSSSSSANRRGRKGGKSGQAAGANPLQDLMESEREKMRVLMHQSFLQQLEQFPLAAAMAMNPGMAGALPPGLLDCLGLPPGLIPGLTSPTSAVSSASSLPAAQPASAEKEKPEEVLNLSTKVKKESKKAPSTPAASTSTASTSKPQHKPLSMQDMMAMSHLPGETRVPVLNLKDHKRLTGDDAPMIKELAQWLADHPHHIIDMPESGIAGLFGDLEPGEIPRPSLKATPTASSAPKAPATPATPATPSTPSTSSSTSAPSWEERITVINRKNGLKLSGSKAPQLKNLIMWLEKNPDWDVDPTQASAVKGKVKVPDKLRSRVSSKPATSAEKKAASSASSSNAAASAAAASAFSGLGGLDPLAGLAGMGLGGLDAATQQLLQMQLMMQLGTSNPMGNPAALLGLPPTAMLSPDILSMLGGGMPSPSSLGLSLPSSVASSAPMTTSTPTSVKETYSRASSSSRKEPSQSKSSRSSSSKQKVESSKASSSSGMTQAQKEALAAAQHLQNLSAEDPLGLGLAGLDAATASALNPFLGAAGGGGIFGGGGLNPFLGGAGMSGLGGLSGTDANSMAAMAQLQSLMGLDAAALAGGFPPGMFGLPPTSAAPAPSPAKKASTPKPESSKTTVSATPPAAAKIPNSGGRKKLNALVDKLAESAAQAQSDSPPASLGKKTPRK